MKTRSYILIMTSAFGRRYGYVEKSFSMSIDPYKVCIFSKQTSSVTWIINTLQGVKTGIWRDVDGAEVCIVKTEIYRVGTKNCPIKIDWRPRFGKTSKYNWRNLPFVSK